MPDYIFNSMQPPTPFWSLFIKKSDPPGFWPKLGYLAFSLASSVLTGFELGSWDSCTKTNTWSNAEHVARVQEFSTNKKGHTRVYIHVCSHLKEREPMECAHPFWKLILPLKGIITRSSPHYKIITAFLNLWPYVQTQLNSSCLRSVWLILYASSNWFKEPPEHLLIMKHWDSRVMKCNEDKVLVKIRVRNMQTLF